MLTRVVRSLTRESKRTENVHSLFLEYEKDGKKAKMVVVIRKKEGEIQKEKETADGERVSYIT